MSKRKAQRKNITQKAKEKERLAQTKVLSSRRHISILLISLSLIAVTLVAFGQLRNHPFLNFDDYDYITKNPHVQSGLTLKGITWAFTTTHAANWHPLTWLSHMLDCQLYGLNPGGHHLTNLVFHIASTLLLFLVLERMTGALWRSSFVAALFALHPLHVESVAWVAERKDVLSTFFWMLTMWTYVLYVERPGFKRYLFVLLSFTLGLLSKPMLVTLPFVLLLLDYWPLGRFQLGQGVGDHKSNTSKSMIPGDQKSILLRFVWEKAPFFVLSALSSILTIFAQQKGGAVIPLEYFPLESRIANALVSYVGYMVKMLWPHQLAVYYPYPEILPPWKVLGAGLLLVCVSLLVIRAFRKLPYLLIGWLWYLGTLVPVIGLVQVGSQAMADRYTYVPLIGLFVMIVWSFPNIWVGWRHRRVILSILAGLLLSLLVTLTKIQVNYWQNNIMLYEHSLAVTSKNFIIHNNLGLALVEQGKIQEAIAHFTEAVRIKPSDTEALYSLGLALYGQGKIQQAAAYFAEALRFKPDYSEAHNNLGFILFGQGKTQEAIAHFTEALKIKPDNAQAQNNLGLALAGQGKIQEAITHYIEALRIKPDYADAHMNLGVAYLMIGNKSSALEEYKILLKINPVWANELYQKISPSLP